MTMAQDTFKCLDVFKYTSHFIVKDYTDHNCTVFFYSDGMTLKQL